MAKATKTALMSKKMHNLSDEDWTARSDAQTLAHAKEIKDDPKRYELAQLWAEVLSEQNQANVNALKAVAKSA